MESGGRGGGYYRGRGGERGGRGGERGRGGDGGGYNRGRGGRGGYQYRQAENPQVASGRGGGSGGYQQHQYRQAAENPRPEQVASGRGGGSGGYQQHQYRQAAENPRPEQVASGRGGGSGGYQQHQYRQAAENPRPEQVASGRGGGSGGRGWSNSPSRGGGGRGANAWEARGRGAFDAPPPPTDPWVPQPQHNSSPALSPADPVSPVRQSLEQLHLLPPSDNTDKAVLVSPEDRVVPVKRPDRGGESSIRAVRLHANHFPVQFHPNSIIWHYDVDVKPEAPSRNGRAVKISKANLTMIRNKLFSDDPTQFPLSKTAYDGEKNIFSAVHLPTGKYRVELTEGEGDDLRVRPFIFSIKLVNELRLCKLKEYLSGNLMSIPRDILQGMDLVMKENPTRHMISVGRGFFPTEPFPKDDLGQGITAARGFQHSLKPTSQGLSLCLDYTVLAFRKRLPVLDFLGEHIRGFNDNNFRDWRKVETTLRGLKVMVTHRRTNQKYTVARLTSETTRNITFDEEDREGNNPPRTVHLDAYFRGKYGKEIVYLNIPCLDVGKNNRKNYVPMEFCVLVEGQRYPKEQLDTNAARMLKGISLPHPKDRKKMISEMVHRQDGPCSGEISSNFGIEVNKNMTRVTGRVIGAPDLKVGSQNGRMMKIAVDKDKCQWNLMGKSLVEGKAIDRWAVLDFSAYERFDRLNPNEFIPKLMNKCRSLGIHMEEPLIYEEASMNKFNNVDALHELINSVNDRCRGGSLQILLCVMAKQHPGYKQLKWVSETKVGIITQCCLSKNANQQDKRLDQYLGNLALKINAKLGGSNVELMNRLTHFERDNHVMFIGADVNHPGSMNRSSPSIAAVVGTINWPAANRYAARVSLQYRGKEKILNFGAMCVELVECYARTNRARPTKIVIFRDGVSEGQFEMVLNEELMDLKREFARIEYNPTITLIVAQKRHQTRLFPESERDGCSTGNVSPGTVVDTTIVHPFEFDFYLCSHYGGIGTSKPTHYYVLWDDHNFTSDGLQKLIYDMCFTFARCTKPVSLVPPVYYADLVAYRGRMYYDAIMEGISSSSQSSSSGSSVAPVDEGFFKLHADLENIMFFI